MNDLIGFIEARLAEDDAYARSVLVETMNLRAGHPASGDRQLLEITAKRAIIAAYVQAADDVEPYQIEHRISFETGWYLAFEYTLKAMAAAYRDHGDWREEWAT